MLDALRKGASGWVAQLFIALLVLSFAVWGVSGFFQGFRADTISTVGKTDITIQTFQRQYDLAKRQMSQQYGRQITDDQARLFGLPGQVLGRLVAEATLDDAARSLGLGVSNKTLAAEVANDPNLRGPSGTFDRTYVIQLLRQNGLTEDQFVTERRATYMRQQIAAGLIGGVDVPDALMQALHEYRNEQRTISYLVLPPSLVGDVGLPSDADLKTYFEAHKADWKAPEYRALTLLTLAPADLAKPADVTDEDAKKAYDAAIDQYTTPELRKVQQIIFKDAGAADQAASELAAGKSFGDLVAARNLKPEDVDLGLVTREKIVDPAVADVAFSQNAGTTSGVIKGQFGPVIVFVETVQPKLVKTFDEVKDAIKQQIATTRASTEVSDQHNVIEDALSGGSKLAEIAQKYALKLVTIPAIDKNGLDPSGTTVAGVPGGLLPEAFQSDVGIQNSPIQPDPNSYVWYDVAGVTAERDRTLDEVHDKLVAAWKDAQVVEKLTAKATEIRDRLAKGEDIATVAGELSLAVKTADKLTRGSTPSEDMSPPAIQAAFEGPKGSVTVAEGTAGAKLVMVVTDATVPPYFAGAPDLAQGKQQLAGQMADDLLQQYVAELQSEIGVSVNQAAVQQAIGAPGS
jgi:peptidyl-prolyl cis-trans isomerase D